VPNLAAVRRRLAGAPGQSFASPVFVDVVGESTPVVGVRQAQHAELVLRRDQEVVVLVGDTFTAAVIRSSETKRKA